MKATAFEEPELQFGWRNHIDIRYGIANYHPFDYESELRPSHIRVGIVGTNQSVEGISSWLEKCRNPISRKKSKKPEMFREFPGFSEESPFLSRVVLDGTLNGIIQPSTLKELKEIPDRDTRVAAAVELFLTEIKAISEKAVDVVICSMPIELTQCLAESVGEDDEEDESVAEDDGQVTWKSRLVFHDLLKARAMSEGVDEPLQLVRPGTYDESLKRKEADARGRSRRLQDEATRAWNFFAALYYKARGFPWCLPRSYSDLETCYAGISFYRSLQGDRLLTSLAQVFNERGLGLIVKGGEVSHKGDRQVHLEEDAAHDLIKKALQSFRHEHKHLPARLVVHKSSRFDEAEMRGVQKAVDGLGVEVVDMVSVAQSRTKMFRAGYFPPLRGSLLLMDDELCVLYTRGSVSFYREYPGMYVPKSLLIRSDRTSSTQRELAKEILGLTKMNWNSTQMDGYFPITIRAAKQVGQILKNLEEGQPFSHVYRFFI